MNNIELYGFTFLLGTAKFLFAATIVTATRLTPFEIFVSTGLGALFSFNVFYWSADYFMKRYKAKQMLSRENGTFKPKPAFTKVNKWMVKIKMSKSGFWVICTLAPLFLSVPLGTIIVAKFYRTNRLSYTVSTVALIFWAYVLAYVNGAIFAWVL